MNVGYIVAAVVLLFANAFFVAAEFGLIAARRTKLESMSGTGSRRAEVALRSTSELSFMLAGAQLGITMASLGLGHVAEPAVAHLLEDALHGLHLPASLTHTIAFVIALLIVSFFHMVFGEMTPKNIAIAEPERTALRLAIPFRLFANVFRPFIAVLNAAANGIVRLLGTEPQNELATAHSAPEIGRMVAESAREGMLREFEHHLLSGAVEFGTRTAGAVMTPRTEMNALPITTTPSEIETQVVRSGHTRYPVYSEDSDHVVGFVHSKDILQLPDSARDKRIPRRLIRPLLVVPETRALHPLLLDMRRERNHLALVVDEHGGTAGIVTMEDLIEELVGDIRDEHDYLEAGIQRVSDHSFLIPGTLRLDEAERLIGLELPDGVYETVSGFLMERLGRVPRRLDQVRHGGWTLRVQRMHRRRVVQVLAERAPG